MVQVTVNKEATKIPKTQNQVVKQTAEEKVTGWTGFLPKKKIGETSIASAIQSTEEIAAQFCQNFQFPIKTEMIIKARLDTVLHIWPFLTFRKTIWSEL